MFDPKMSEVITIPQASKYAAVSETAIRQPLIDGKMAGIKKANTWFTTREAVDHFFKQRQSDWLNKRRREEKAAKIRAGWHCKRCGALDPREQPEKGHSLEKMTIYYKDGNDENYSANNMLVLCWECYFFTIKHYNPHQMTLPGMELPDWLR